MIVTSSPDTSTYALSTPSPAKADIRCSTVEMRTPSRSITVAIVVLLTFNACAGTAGLPGRSVRQKTIPVSTGAGRSTIVTLRPVCRPTPVARTSDFRVRCRIICSILSGLYTSRQKTQKTGPVHGPASVGLLAQESRNVEHVHAGMPHRLDRHVAPPADRGGLVELLVVHRGARVIGPGARHHLHHRLALRRGTSQAGRDD